MSTSSRTRNMRFCKSIWSIADEIREKTGESPDGLYLYGYDFGGEADVWIDVVRNRDHMAYAAIISAITGTEYDEFDTGDF